MTLAVSDLELLFLTVLAFPNASSTGFDCIYIIESKFKRAIRKVYHKKNHELTAWNSFPKDNRALNKYENDFKILVNHNNMYMYVFH